MNCPLQHIGNEIVCPDCGFRMRYVAGNIQRNCTLGHVPKPPGLIDMAQHFVTDMATWAGAGFPVNTQAEHDRRLGICKGCDWFDGAKCKDCGCVCSWASYVATKGCPQGKWALPAPKTPVE